MMTPPNALLDVGRYAAALQGLQNLDNAEVLPVVKGLLSLAAREECFVAAYYRTVANARSLLVLKDASHFQAIAMLARGMFELAVDVALVDKIPDAVTKIYAYARLERLRAARPKVKLAADGIITDDVTIEEQFITNNEAKIEADSQALWPKTKKQRPVSHWSDLALGVRTKVLGARSTN